MPSGLNDETTLDEGMVPVIMPSGASFYVHEQEFQYFKDRCTRYQADNDFQNVSDLQDLDRLLQLELLSYRRALWLSQQRDYWGEPVDDNTLQKALKDHSGEIRLLKKNMGLDRETREKVRGEDSPANYLAQLRIRAKHFGYMRNEQAAKAIELFQEMVSKITLHDNCDEKERVEQGVQTEDIMTWLRETAIPEFNEIDEKFRDTDQKNWIRGQ